MEGWNASKRSGDLISPLMKPFDAVWSPLKAESQNASLENGQDLQWYMNAARASCQICLTESPEITYKEQRQAQF